jgi:PAS domain S-box-containing protein
MVGQPRTSRRLSPAAIAVVYVAIGVAYIVLSDLAVSVLVADPAARMRVETFKGAGFMLVTGLLLLVLLRRDAAAARREEAARRRTEERLRAILEHEPECVKVTTPDGRLLEMNRAGLAMIEAESVEAVRGADVSRLVAEGHRGAFREMMSRVAAGAREEMEFEIVGLRGTRRWLHMHAVRLPGDGAHGDSVLAVTRDVTARRRAEEEARTAGSLLELVTDTLPVYLSYVCATERYRWVNRRYEEWYGLPRERIVGRRIDELQPPEAYEAMRPYIRRALAGERVRYSNTLTGPDGRAVVFDTQYLPHVDAEGRVAGFFVLVADNSERARAAEALARSEERYRSMFEQAAVGLAHADFDGRLLLVNDRLCSILGYTREELRERSLRELTHPDDLGRNLELVAEARAGRRDSYTMEKRYIRKDGSIVWATLTSAVVRDAQGRPLHLVAVVQDITDRRRAEAALRESEARYRAVVEDQTELICRFRRDGTLTFVNDAYARYFGRPAAALVGRSFADFIPDEEERRRVLGLLATITPANPVVQFEIGWRMPDGRMRWRHWIDRGLFDERGVLAEIQGVGRDVTEQKDAQRRLARAEEWYRTLFEQSPDGVMVIDPGTARPVDFNRVMHEMLGYTREEFAALPVTAWDASATPEDPASLTRRAGLAGGQDLETRVRTRSGRILDVAIKSRPVTLEGRRVLHAVLRDVTERKRAEQEMRDTRWHLERAQQAGHIGAWVWEIGPEGALWWSDETCRIFGIPRDRFDGRVETFSRAVHPEDLGGVRHAADRAIAGEAPYSVDHRIIRADGEERWVHQEAQVERDAGGAPVRMIGIVQDITERRLAEQALRQSEERFRGVFESASVGIARTTPEGVFLEVNPALAAMLGRGAGELVGRSFLEITHPDDAGASLEWVRRVAEGRARSATAEKRCLRADGSYLWTSVSIAPVTDGAGRVVSLIGVVADLTERRRAEEALRQSEATTRALLEAVPDLLFRMSRDGRYLGCHAPNPADLILPPEQFLGRSAAEVLPGDLGEATMRALEAVFRTGEPQTYEYERERAGTGQKRYWEARVVRCGAEEALVLVRDISQRKRAEIELRLSRERLALLVERTPLGVIVWDTQGRVVEWNPGAERIFGYTGAEAAGRRFDFIVPDHAREEVEAAWRALVNRQGGVRGTNDNADRNGRIIRCEWYNATLVGHDGRVVGVASVVQDVTDREAAAEALRRSEVRYRRLFDTNLDAIFVTDGAGVVTEANDAACALLGRARGAMVGRRLGEAISPVRGGDWARGARSRPGVPAAAGEVEIVRADGERRFIEYTSSPVMPGQVMTIVRDVTERRRAERRQATMMAELDHRVKNNLAAVLSLAEQSARGAASVEAFVSTLIGRIRAMARMHSALAGGRWEGAALRQLVRQSLEAYMLHGDGDGEREGRIVARGPEVWIPARAVSPLAMALHELATNAAKYGALRAPIGRVDIAWTVEEGADGSGPRLSLLWTESGGPRVAAPVKAGFGTQLIRGGIAYELRGNVVLEFPPEGARCRIELPLAEDGPRDAAPGSRPAGAEPPPPAVGGPIIGTRP